MNPAAGSDPFSLPADTVQDLVLHLRRRLAVFGGGKQEIYRLGGLAKVVHTVRTAPIEVFFHLRRLLRFQQAQQEQLINVV
jgi:hypothetical protein